MNRRSILATMLAMAAAPAIAATETGVPPADREFRVPVRGGSLYVRVNGDLASRRPPLVLVHGGPGGALWQMFPALPLAADRAVILYDQLDSGRSDAPGDPANWTVDRFADEIAAINDALGVRRAHVLGHSWGGIVATRYAARQPAGLQSLILQGTPLSAARSANSVKTLLAALPDGAGALIEANDPDAPGFKAAMQAFMKKHLNRTSLRDIGMPYMAPTPEDRGDALALAMTGGDLTAGFQGVLKGFNDEPLLGRIVAPTLLLGAEDDIMTAADTRALLPMLKNGRYAEIAGAGHMVQFDQPQAWRDAVAGFIKNYD
jgi:proline-specific peptidase